MWLAAISLVLCLARLSAGKGIPGNETARTPSEVTNEDNLKAGNSCEPGTTWTSRCNQCHCTPPGERACTDKACSDNEPEVYCAPDSAWKKDCNTCWCLDSKAVCTRMGCGVIQYIDIDQYRANLSRTTTTTTRKTTPTMETTTTFKSTAPTSPSPPMSRPPPKTTSPPSSTLPPPPLPSVKENRDKIVFVDQQENYQRPKRGSQDPPKTCLPGQEFRLDCNKCLCNNEGQYFSCTRNDCTKQNGNGNGGVRRKREINSGFRCNPGEQSKRDCNDCTCSADGKRVFCTVRLCNEDITDGI